MGIGSFFKKIGNGIADVAKDIGEGIADVGGEIIETVGDVGKAAIKGDIKGMVHAVGDGVVDIAKSVGENALEIGKSVGELSPGSLIMDVVSDATGIDIKEKVLDITANTLGSAVPLLGPALKAGVYTVAGESEKAKDAIDMYKDGRFLNDMPLVGTIKAGVEGRWTDFAIGLASDATFLIPGAGAAAGMALKTVGKTVAKEAVEAGVKTIAKEGAEELVEAGAKTALKEGAEEIAEEGAEAGAKTLTQKAKDTVTDKIVETKDDVIATAQDEVKSEVQYQVQSRVESKVQTELAKQGLALPTLPAVPQELQAGLSVAQSMSALRQNYGG